ncbi:3-isopropylmalate dehydratase small subunit [Rhodococcus sp. 06-156-3C]|uniref:3-isopropylmalate dehydratase small subunit n=1 Tax=Nocardiaceae TaxID=85025 RepID=UPI0005230B60|nr:MULTISPECIES: 3-isopropylmalate dehydratase small subunit [Rhodococcus]OZD11336.1 3-isopropylmalate dehydratase small subunit [Rhodococcus sp. 06-156-3C]OZD13570.1 3-isopropylmalate dehydratase small subunit [Rhodococcus sp. 06-156-4a]OZD22090.1 3-isopropylmalate dehydratase small subunit [Rhodococcus sp. 06-156-4C]OZD30194.1 3-isopropylmalate dehydratase small subunit [Rhodococcus sp. 06-156-3]OZD37601.1 3-isopropylmalate dehydratase small subunit [Rhodococcus sp. 06-156-3b]
MKPFTEHTGIGLPLRISDVDTDQIIPARFCVGVTKEGYEDALMHDWRAQPDFVLNRPEHQGATVLIAGENFGVGSSREMAVWALQNYGFRVVFAPRFGDIFRGNSLKNGLLTITLDQQVIDLLWKSVETSPSDPITVDLIKRQVRCEGRTHAFDLDDNARMRLLNGYDDISLTLRNVGDIDNYEATRRRTLPTTRRVPAGVDNV